MTEAALEYAPAEMIRAAQGGDGSAMESLLDRNTGLIYAVIHRFSDRAARIGSDSDDLFQLASIGFMKAVRQFDLSLSYRFSTYAVPLIAGEIRRFLRDDGPLKVSRSLRETAGKIEAAREYQGKKLGREPTVSEIAAAAGMTPEEVAAQEHQMPLVIYPDEEHNVLENLPDPASCEERVLDRLSLAESIDALPERERNIIRFRYLHDLTQQKTADLLGISQVQVSRIERSALIKLRQQLL